MRADIDVMKALYSKPMVDIISQITKVIKQCEGVSMLLLVGGFSESEMLQHSIRKEFPDKRIIVPEDAGLSVLKGAVLFGQNPDYISSRVMRYTYGYQVKSEFNHNKHPKAKLVMIDGQEMCRYIFSTVKKINEDTSSGTKVTKTILTTTKFQRGLKLPVFASTKEDPMYTDESGCFHIGTVKIEISQPSEDNIYFDVEFNFGNTEFTVTVTERETGHSETSKFDFV